jgi:uncharacterized protein (DUF2126 family)/transglutaminase-like putative cysteine protease
MAIRVALNHKTSHRYGRDAWLSPHVLRLHPAPHCRTPVLSYSLKIVPSEHFINWQQDPYSNRLARLVFPKKTRELTIEVDLIADMTVINPFDFFLESYADDCPFEYDPILKRELAPYFAAEPASPRLAALVTELRRPKTPTVDYLVALNQSIKQRVSYLIRLEAGIQTPEETLVLASGSCRDSAWLLVHVLRQLGLAARFVSGYLIQLAPDVKSLDGPSGVEKDFVDLHAWTEVYLPGAGWIGLDPTSGMLAGEGHLPLACSADPVAAAAVSGFYSYDNAEVALPEADLKAAADSLHAIKDEFEFSMSITRIHEDPRVTKPYTDEQWSEIEALGHQVDADLLRGDVRLTMGGEPTFVSLDDVDAEEWNGDALGPQKYGQGDKLIRRLRDRFAPGGFLHHGQGKWYPGEPLPRWAFALYWRKDGRAIWNNPLLAADETKPTQATADDARGFANHLARALGIETDTIEPGYEDAWYYLWKERRLPVNVDPHKSNLANAEDRARLAKVFEEGLDKVTGYALPLKRTYLRSGGSAWETGPWFLRAERMYLIPGDAPMGFRLPLESIPWVAPSEFPHVLERDPLEVRGPLPDIAARSRQRAIVTGSEVPRGLAELVAQAALAHATVDSPALDAADVDDSRPSWLTPALPAEGHAAGSNGSNGAGYPPSEGAYTNGTSHADDDTPSSEDSATNFTSPSLPPAQGVSSPETVRTALCVEARGGVLRVFMPPLRNIEDYLELVAAIETTAAQLKMPVLVEGYTPPHDPRINEIKVTPDPGVLEVNTKPVDSWDELVSNTTALYEEARECRLGTEKFMLDGRHIGTGGGNHIVIGGKTPADSPLLRRPDLLRSLIGFWHNHPALSYLFSGFCVGPTSQAPRIDEARNDQVYELEIACKQIPDHGSVPPWLVDRIFRNLLVDSTGNTHRSEFCIDKLYAPESASGRLGLLEMRGFEMPPHAQMSLTQQLLIRALVARFWEKPYAERLVRWRTEIHDRFLLPHFVRQDLEDVIFDLNNAGYPLKTEWFAPHFEFRFPHCGTIRQRGIVLELRQAIEPWNVLGEVPGIGSTVRYVDSSVERLQVLVDGMVDSRHTITCNGIALPLHPTGTNGQFVSGVRFRAWQPPECLHPTIGVHSPLVFDVYDNWSGRSIGGCTYYVAHPGGLSYDRFPVNAYEAEARRISRFSQSGHTPGSMTPREVPKNKEFPFTLDLRQH